MSLLTSFTIIIHLEKDVCEVAVQCFEKNIEKKNLHYPPCALESDDSNDGYCFKKSTPIYTWEKDRKNSI